MDDLLERIHSAATWEAYYAAYMDVYVAMFAKHWAMGMPTFANHVHHPAIPDASGAIGGISSWAAYSQPSRETLVASLGVFVDLLRIEPFRQRSNRYLLLTPRPPSMSKEQVSLALGEAMARKVDVWSSNIEDCFSWPQDVSVLQSANVLFEQRAPLISRERADDIYKSSQPKQKLRDLCDEWRRMAPSTQSTVPQAFIPIHLSSSILLAGFRLGLSPKDMCDAVGNGAGLASCFASIRANDSRWPVEAEQFATEIQNLDPMQTRAYTIKPNDILSRVVRKLYEQPFETMWPLISVVNPTLSDPNRIRIGQIIRLPVLGGYPLGLAS